MNDDRVCTKKEQQAHELPSIRQISVVEFKGMMESAAVYELVDVRTEGERAIATIEGFRLLDQTYHDDLMERDPETRLILQCHHGIRSQHAAE